MSAKILGISGSTRQDPVTLRLVRIALQEAAANGAETRLLDVRDYPLPIYNADEDYDSHPVVSRIIEEVTQADGYILGSPEYHGCMSGATKNFLDFLYREIAGKVFGLVAATGGSLGVGCFDNMRAAIQYCHGWTLPYHISATSRDFDESGELINPKTRDRLQRMGRDIAVYAPLLYGQFQADRNNPKPSSPGFANWMG